MKKLVEILSVDSVHIIALDARGNRVTIAIADCINNFYREFMGAEYVVTGNDRMIGERNSQADPRYFIFHSNPRYCIEVDRDRFDAISDVLSGNNLQTFDRT